MNYKKIPEEFLIEKYTKCRLSAKKISEELKCGETTIFRALELHNIKRRTSCENQNPLFGKEPNKDELIYLHHTKHLSLNKIAKNYNTSWGNIKRLFSKYSIKTKSHDEIIRPQGYIEPTKRQLKKWLYTDNFSTSQIGKRLGLTSTTIRKLIKKRGLFLKKTIKNRRPSGFWTNERVIEKIQELNTSGTNLSARFMSINYGGLFKGALSKFGSWENAITCAGIDYKKIKGQYYKYLCEDGNRVLSIPEMQTANWLYKNKIKYDYETKVSTERMFKTDFKVGKFWIEVLGGWAYKKNRGIDYRKRFDEKKTLFQFKNGAGTLDFYGGEIEKYKEYIDTAPAVMIKLLPRDNELKEKQLNEQIGFLLELKNNNLL